MATAVIRTLAPVVNTAAEKLAWGPSDWTLVHTNDAAASNVLAAITGVQHFLKHVTVSYSAAPADSTLTVSDGVTVIWQTNLPATGPLLYVFDFSGCPLHATEGASLTVAVTDPGGAVVATVSCIGKSSTHVTAFT